MSIVSNVILSPYTTYNIGGTAEKFAIALTSDELIQLLQTNCNPTIIGGGSNILVSSKGIKGLTIKVATDSINLINEFIEVDAGVKLSTLSRYMEEFCLGGLEWACSIPGTVGGGCRINAGAFGGDIASCVAFVEFFRDGKIICQSSETCGFSYRNSNFRDGDIILRAKFKRIVAPKEDIRERRKEFIKIRKQTQPTLPSAGSVFLSNKKGAGYYIEQCGLKSFCVGDAMVSEKHANFIVNKGSASSDDVLQIIKIIQKRVYERFGIKLKEEIKFLGER